jgi:23S rRNA (uracil1939-C5)-methyltransferase
LVDRCGGCPLQHLNYQSQLDAKSRIIGDALRRIGGFDVPDPRVEAAPEEFGYRSVVSFTLKRLPGGRVLAGFHERGRPGRIVDVGLECLLPESRVSAVWGALRARWGERARRLPPGRELRLTLRGVDEGAVLFADGGLAGGDAPGIVAEVPGLHALWHRPEGGDWRCLAGEPALFVEAFSERVRVAPGAFTQINRAVADALRVSVLEEIGPPKGIRVIDAFCGTAVHGRRLAHLGALVVGLELDPHAVRAAREGAPDGFTVVEGKVEQTLSSVLPAERVILNPPRRGVDAEVAEILRGSPVDRLIYVSCDPATLARDLARLGPGYTIRRIQAFDLFPQTSHVETVVTLDSSPRAVNA